MLILISDQCREGEAAFFTIKKYFGFVIKRMQFFFKDSHHFSTPLCDQILRLSLVCLYEVGMLCAWLNFAPALNKNSRGTV
jgi:hypothetical protein